MNPRASTDWATLAEVRPAAETRVQPAGLPDGPRSAAGPDFPFCAGDSGWQRKNFSNGGAGLAPVPSHQPLLCSAGSSALVARLRAEARPDVASEVGRGLLIRSHL